MSITGYETFLFVCSFAYKTLCAALHMAAVERPSSPVCVLYLMYSNFFPAVQTHTWATTGILRQPYEGCTYCFRHEEAYTNGHQLYDFKELGVDLEVEGVHYIDMHREQAAYVLGPPPSRGGDLELEGGVNVSL